MKLARPLEKLSNAFASLPGVGPKTAMRLAFYMLHMPQDKLDSFAAAVEGIRKDTKLCRQCWNVCESDICNLCSDEERDKNSVCVVSQSLDIVALERAGVYRGGYHVLHGVISPLEGIGPDEIKIGELLARLEADRKIDEVILAINQNMEGEATSMYIAREIGKLYPNIRVTRLGRGLPVGSDIEYADAVTLKQAMEARKQA